MITNCPKLSRVYVLQTERTRTGSTRRARLFGVDMDTGRIVEITRAVAMHSPKLPYDDMRSCISIRGYGVSISDYLRPHVWQAVGHEMPIEKL